ncbi:MAG TPA: DUF6302 family protein [Candidatus Acidoferrum sp.]|jgi:hypothetical protein|nr:DUF6302 family protein [Candidatus Acidoferrum sp.]
MRRNKIINWDFFKDRLEDPSLLKNSVPIVCDGMTVDLAVPVGGKRRGGYVALATLRWCREAVRQLKAKPGFPNLRIVDGRPFQCMHNVEWGDPQPECDTEDCAGDDVERGRYFGFSEAAIERFVMEHAQ